MSAYPRGGRGPAKGTENFLKSLRRPRSTLGLACHGNRLKNCKAARSPIFSPLNNSGTMGHKQQLMRWPPECALGQTQLNPTARPRRGLGCLSGHDFAGTARKEARLQNSAGWAGPWKRMPVGFLPLINKHPEDNEPSLPVVSSAKSAVVKNFPSRLERCKVLIARRSFHWRISLEREARSFVVLIFQHQIGTGAQAHGIPNSAAREVIRKGLLANWHALRQRRPSHTVVCSTSARFSAEKSRTGCRRNRSAGPHGV